MERFLQFVSDNTDHDMATTDVKKLTTDSDLLLLLMVHLLISRLVGKESSGQERSMVQSKF